MSSTILVTGACGNIGQNVLNTLAETDCKIKVLDLDTPVNRKVAESYPNAEFIWADICDEQGVTQALQGVDTVIHLIGIIPPLTESNPELARKVNNGGMRTLIDAMEASSTAKRLIFTSTFAVLGIGDGTNRIHTADMPFVQTDVYSETKIACEKMIHESKLVWTILRLSAIPNVDPSAHNIKDMALSLKIGPNDYIEFCHAKDVARATVNATLIEAEKVQGQTFMIGGGDNCRLNGYEFTCKLFIAAGIGALPLKFFTDKPSFYAGWVDSETSNALLDYQYTSYDDFTNEFHERLGKFKYYGARLVAPFIRLALGFMSKSVHK